MPQDISLKIRDETTGGQRVHELDLKFVTDEVTVREIIAERVRMEIDSYHLKIADFRNSLVQPKDAERRLNQKSAKRQRPIDGEKQIELALAAFERNGFFMLIDGHQAESLDETVKLSQNPTISFIKLTPLVGG